MPLNSVEWLKAWFVFSISAGCWTALGLGFHKQGDRAIKFKILTLIALLLAHPLNAFFGFLGSGPVEWLQVTSQRLTWCYGPILLALAQHVTLTTVRPWWYRLQFVPFLVVWLNDAAGLQAVNMGLGVLLLWGHVFGYLFFTGFVLWRHRPKLRNLTHGHTNTLYFWLLYMLLGITALMLLDVAVYTRAWLGNAPPLLELAVIASFSGLLLNLIAVFAMYQPHWLDPRNAPEALPDSPTAAPALRAVELSPQAAQELQAQLLALMEHHKPHLDDEISLPKLASLLGVSTHKLSELFNIHMNTSFYDFLNDRRYEEALKYLHDAGQALTINDIAYRARFNNRNTFYKVFNGKTGHTPHEYRKYRRP